MELSDQIADLEVELRVLQSRLTDIRNISNDQYLENNKALLALRDLHNRQQYQIDALYRRIDKLEPPWETDTTPNAQPVTGN